MPSPVSDANLDPGSAEFAAELGALADQFADSISQPAILARDQQAELDGGGDIAQHLTTILQIPVAVKAVLGSTSVPIAKLMKLKRGTILPLDRRVGEPIELVVNGRVVARGEIVVLEDGVPHLGISLTEVISRTSQTGGEDQATRLAKAFP